MNGENGIPVIIGAGEQGLKFKFVEGAGQLGKVLQDLAGIIGALVHHVGEFIQVVQIARELVNGFHPSLVDGDLSGFVRVDLEIGLDTLDFESINILSGELNYTTEKDTLEFDKLALTAEQIYLGNEISDQDYSGLSFIAGLSANRCYSNHFQLDDIHYDIETEKGVITIYPAKFRFFGKEGQGY